MHLALGGHYLDDPQDPIWLVPPVVDVPVLPVPVSQERLEDLQLYGFLSSVAVQGGQHPLEITVPRPDPPDRRVSGPAGTWGVELTALTLEHVRAELGPVRAAGRKLQATLESTGEHEHLRGRVVTASVLLGQLPKDPDADIAAVAEALKEDRGCAELPFPLPDRLDEIGGRYGDFGAFNVQVDARGVPARITVAATTQAEIRRSEALASLVSRISDKDDPRNDVLLITCGLPGKNGYLCSVDEWIFQHIVDSLLPGKAVLLGAAPEHLSAVVLTRWSTGEWLEIYRADGATVPWAR